MARHLGDPGNIVTIEGASRFAVPPLLRRRMRGMAGSQGLGDVICYRWEQRAAAQALVRMRSVFESLGKPASYAAAVASIEAEWKSYDNVWADWTLCSAKAIGQRAEALTNRMLAATGQQALGPDPSLRKGPLDELLDTLSTIFKWTVLLGLLGVGTWGAYRLARSTPGRQLVARARGALRPGMSGAVHRRRRLPLRRER